MRIFHGRMLNIDYMYIVRVSFTVSTTKKAPPRTINFSKLNLFQRHRYSHLKKLGLQVPTYF